MLMYNHKFGNHNIDALVGYSAQKYSNEYNQLTATDFPSDDIPWMGAGATKNGDNNIEQWALASVIARANYSFKDRYLLQATFRRDGCSRFGQAINMQIFLPYPPDGLYLTKPSWNQ